MGSRRAKQVAVSTTSVSGRFGMERIERQVGAADSAGAEQPRLASSLLFSLGWSPFFSGVAMGLTGRGIAYLQ